MTSQYNQMTAGGFKTYDKRGNITPNFEYSEGTRPAGEFQVAPYLSAVRYNQYFEEHFVVSAGKAVAFDANGYLVPAGLKIDMDAYVTAFEASNTDVPTDKAAGRAACINLYTQTDVDRGVLNAKGVAAAVGEPVVEALLDITVSGTCPIETNISKPVGLASYNYWMNPGGNGVNPAQYGYSNFNLQGRVAFVCDYQVEFPLVEEADVPNTPLVGMAVMAADADTVAPGMFVTYDARSNFVLSGDDSGYGYGTTTAVADVLGQVMSVDLRTDRDLLSLVRSRYSNFGELEKMPGTATEGKSDTLTYSGGYGVVRINLQLR